MTGSLWPEMGGFMFNKEEDAPQIMFDVQSVVDLIIAEIEGEEEHIDARGLAEWSQNSTFSEEHFAKRTLLQVF